MLMLLICSLAINYVHEKVDAQPGAYAAAFSLKSGPAAIRWCRGKNSSACLVVQE